MKGQGEERRGASEDREHKGENQLTTITCMRVTTNHMGFVKSTLTHLQEGFNEEVGSNHMNIKTLHDLRS